MKYIRIVNWEKFQHYTKRNPPWIKVYHKLFDKREFICLQDASKLLLIFLWLLRCRLEKDIPYDINYIKSILPLKGKINIEPLVKHGFIEVYDDASTRLASCQQNACLETETETETEKENCKKKRFQKPTIEELSQYAAGIQFNDFDSQQFLDYYEAKGWMIGRAPMKNWKAAVRTWKNRAVTPAKIKLFPIAGKTCSKSGCGLPAVYKNDWGAYCGDHMPDKVKEKYTW
jgi:hypothetical protein